MPTGGKRTFLSSSTVTQVPSVSLNLSPTAVGYRACTEDSSSVPDTHQKNMLTSILSEENIDYKRRKLELNCVVGRIRNIVIGHQSKVPVPVHTVLTGTETIQAKHKFINNKVIFSCETFL